MLGVFGGESPAGGRTSLRVAVAGDKGTGKSSLISAVASETFPDNVPRVLPPITLPADAFPDYIPITIVDTPSRSSFLQSSLYFIVILKENKCKLSMVAITRSLLHGFEFVTPCTHVSPSTDTCDVICYQY